MLIYKEALKGASFSFLFPYAIFVTQELSGRVILFIRLLSCVSKHV